MAFIIIIIRKLSIREVTSNSGLTHLTWGRTKTQPYVLTPNPVLLPIKQVAPMTQWLTQLCLTPPQPHYNA